MRKILITVAAALCGFALANASTIKTWTTETLRYTDLNSNFAHIHDNMVGGHGARLVNADVSTSAAIAHSKMATPALLPKLFAGVTTTVCAAGTCTMDLSSGVTSVTFVSTGIYLITIPARANAAYSPFATAHTADMYCQTTTLATTSYRVECRNNTGTVTNSSFSTFILDNDN